MIVKKAIFAAALLAFAAGLNDQTALYGASADRLNSAPAGGAVLVQDNAPVAVIVVKADSSISQKNAAQTLVKYIKESSGAELSIQDSNNLPSDRTYIFIGDAAAEKLGINLQEMDGNGWLIQCKDGHLYLTGGAPRGTEVAVWHFLEEQLGVRWWTPWETDIPKHKDILISDCSGSGKPAFESFCFVSPAVENNLSQTSLSLRFNDIVYFAPAHYTMNFVPPSYYFDKRPDWFAQVGGQRQKRAQDYCMTAAGLPEQYALSLCNVIEQRKSAAKESGAWVSNLYGMGREDNAPWCECPACAAYYATYSKSDLYMSFVNKVAEIVKQKHPDVKLVYSAYQATSELPKAEKPNDNVVVWYCTEPMDFSKSIKDPANKETYDKIMAWSNLLGKKNLAIWHYARSFERYRGGYTPVSFAKGACGGLDWPLATLEFYPEFFRFLSEAGAKHILIQNEDSLLFRDAYAMKHWALLKFLENYNYDYQELIKTFTDGYYGAAGIHIRRYLEALISQQQAVPPQIYFFADLMAYKHLTLQFCLNANRILAEAEAAVKGADPFESRVRYFRATSIDRVFIFKWAQFMRQWRLSGYSVEKFPIEPTELYTRARAAFEWFGRISGLGKEVTEPIEQWIELAQKRLVVYVDMPVPSEFKKHRKNSIYQIPPQSYSFDYSGNRPARLNQDFDLKYDAINTVEPVEDRSADSGFVKQFADDSNQLVWKKIETWGGVNNASAKNLDVYSLSDQYQWVELGRYYFDTVNSGLAFEFGQLKWNYYPLDLQKGEYDVWLHLKYDKDKKILSMERLIATKTQ